MNITKELYKRYDKDNKGYVTIGDMKEDIAIIFGSPILFGWYFYSMYLSIFKGILQPPNQNISDSNSILLVPWSEAVWIISSAVSMFITTPFIILIVLYGMYQIVIQMKVVSDKRQEK